MDGQQQLLLRALRGVGSSRDGNALAVLGLGGRAWVEQRDLPVSTSVTSTAQHMEPRFQESWGCPCPVFPHNTAHPEPHSSPDVSSPSEPDIKLELEVLPIHHSLLTFLQGALSFPSLNQGFASHMGSPSMGIPPWPCHTVAPLLHPR